MRQEKEEQVIDRLLRVDKPADEFVHAIAEDYK